MRLYYAFLIIFLIFSLESAGAQSSDFEVSALVVKNVVKEGESVANPVSVISHLAGQKFNIELFSEFNFISSGDNNFLLGKDDSKTLDFVFDSKGLDKGVYAGRIIVSGVEDSEILPVVLEVESHSLTFDVSAEEGLKYKEVSPGEDYKVNVKVYNLGSESGDVGLHYAIKDTKGKLILSESQDLNVNNQAELSKTFLIPDNAEFGDYVFLVIAEDSNSGFVGTSSSLFSVSEEVLKSPDEVGSGFSLSLAFVIIIVLIAAFLVINYYWNRRVQTEAKEWNRKLVDVKKVKFSDVGREVRKLEEKKKLLESTYEKGYIKKESYDEGKRKINELISRLKKRL